MAETKDRVIIDTNLWISFLLTKDFSKLDKLLANHSITLLFSQELLDEFIVVTSTTTACRDQKDNFLLSLAADGKATHLLTGDKDLLNLGKYEKTEIITISAYLTDRELL